jgi:hypothetical protein
MALLPGYLPALVQLQHCGRGPFLLSDIRASIKRAHSYCLGFDLGACEQLELKLHENFAI